MPLFGGKSKKDKEKNSPGPSLIDSNQSPAAAAVPASVVNADLSSSNTTMASTPAAELNGAVPQLKPKLVFHCQQAQGSPTGMISNFANVKELYQKIADCYDLEPNQVIRH